MSCYQLVITITISHKSKSFIWRTAFTCNSHLNPLTPGTFSKKCLFLDNLVIFRLDLSQITFKPLTPVPAVTGCAKTHPQFPVLAVTSRKKACEENRLSYPLEEILVLLLFYCCSGQITPMRMDILSIFFGGL